MTQILSGKLKEFGLSAERVDYNKPILTQITDADVLVNGLGKLYITAVTKHPDSKKGRIDKNNNNNNRWNCFINIIQGVEALSDSLIDVDYISLHTPLTDETRGLIGAKEINSMKNSAFLINVARAQIVERGTFYIFG